jgi:aryl-alcohol dehydrogenase-like predicted oxidoreductase
MQTRRLGNSDLMIAPVGCGSWAIGGTGWEYAWGPVIVGARNAKQAEGVMLSGELRLSAEDIDEIEDEKDKNLAS